MMRNRFSTQQHEQRRLPRKLRCREERKPPFLMSRERRLAVHEADLHPSAPTADGWGRERRIGAGILL